MLSNYTRTIDYTRYYIVIFKYYIIKQSLSFDTGGYGNKVIFTEVCDMILPDPNNLIPRSSKDNSCIKTTAVTLSPLYI